MDQNTTTLLSTLIGGVLSTGGGFLANYWFQKASRKEDKKKTIKDMIEKIYIVVDNIQVVYIGLEDVKKSYYDRYKGLTVDNAEFFDEDAPMNEFSNGFNDVASRIKTSVSEIEMLINLYLKPLQTPFEEYKSSVDYIVDRAFEESTNPEYALEVSILEGASTRFKQSLTALLKKEGYSYL